MPDLNDVVRHVTLRIRVDQGRLAEDLAAARAKLKAFEQAERDSNKNRRKDADSVTNAILAQNRALEENARAHANSDRSASSNAAKTAADHRDATGAIKAETKAVAEQAIADAKAAEVRAQTSRKNLLAAEDLRRKQRSNFLAEMLETSTLAAAQKALDQDALKRANELRVARAKNLADISISGSKAQSEANRTRTSAAQTGTAEVRFADTEDAAALGWIERRRKARQAEAVDAQALSLITSRAELAEERLTEAVRRRDRARQKELGGLKGFLKELVSISQHLIAAGADAVPARETRVTRAIRAFDANPGRPGTADAARAFVQGPLTRTQNPVLNQLFSDSKQTREASENLDTLRTRVGKLRTDLSNPGSGGFFKGIRDGLKEFATSGTTFDRLSGGLSRAKKDIRELESSAGSIRRLATSVTSFGRGASSTIDRTLIRLRAMREEVRRTGNSELPARLQASFLALSNGVDRLGKNFAKHFLSFRTLIVGVIAALGPLGAIIGSVGAAALGLAGNLGSLSGVLFALPGLISAAAGAFGVLAAILGPLTNVFSAYKAVTDANTKSSQAHKDAVTDEAQAQEKLSEARKTAARRIQDYRLALQKLKYDEEGAQLGVENAEQNLRRVLADPSATALDRRNAIHAVEGAKFDRAQQTIDTGRTKEDAAQAEKKGVDGSDEVVAALQALAKAQKDLKAGSSAAADAQDKLEAALGRLGPKTRELIEKGIKPLGKDFENLRKDLEDDVFGPLLPDVGKFKGLLGSLRELLEPTAKAMGELAHEAVVMLSSPEWKSFFSTQGKENATTVKTLGTAFLSIAGAFKGIVVAARPFTQWLTTAFAEIADKFDKWANSVEGQKSIIKFLGDTRKRIEELWPVIKNVASGIAGFWDALTQTGGADDNFTTKINKGLLGMSETFADLGKKASDPNGGFQKWLRDVGPLIKATVTAVGELLKFVGRLFSDNANINEAKSLLGTLSETILPRLSDIFEHLSASGMVSNIADGIGGLLTAFDNFLAAGGITGLALFFELLSKIGTILGYLTTRFDGLTKVVAILGTALGAFVALSLLARLTRFFTLITGLKTVVGGIIGLFKGAKGLGGFLDNVKGAVTGKVDSTKDDILGQDKGTAAAERNARNTGGKGAQPDLTGTGNAISHLSRIERRLNGIHDTLKVCCAKGGLGGSGKDEPNRRNQSTGGTASERPRPGSTRPGRPGRGGIVGAATTVGVTTLTAGGESIRDRIEGTVRGTAGPGSVTSTATGIPGTTIGSTLTEQRRDAVEASRRNRTTGGTPLGNNERTADRTIRRPFDVVSSGPLRTGARPSTTDFDIVDSVDDQERRRARREALGQPSLESRPTRRQLTAGPSATQQALPSRRQRSLTAGPDRPGTGFDTVEDQKNRRTDFDVVETADERRPRPQLPSAARPELPVGSVPAPRDSSGKFRPVDQGEARPTPQRGSGGQFTSTEKPAKPSLVNTGSDYNVYTDADGRPITETGERPKKRRYTGVSSEGVKSFTEPTPGMRANAETRSRADRITAVAEARERRLRDGTGLGRTESAARLAIEDDARGNTRGARLRGLGRRALNFVFPDQSDAGSAPVETTRGRRRDRTITPDVDEPATTAPKRSLLDRVLGRNKPNVIPDTATDAPKGMSRAEWRRRMTADIVDNDAPTDTKPRRGIDVDEEPRRSRFGRRGGRGLAGLGEEVAETATRGGRLGRVAGRAGRLAGGLGRGLAGGLVGLAITGAAQVGGDYLLNKFVKNDEDKGSLSRGIGAVSTGAGIGATIGSIVPGVGTAIGGAIGGLAGGAYSLYKDKNLRNFVGGKISGAFSTAKDAVGGALSTAKDAVGGAASAAWGGIKSAGSAVKDIFTGGGGGPAAMALGPIGGLLAKTDIGKSIFDSLNKAGGKIGDFFTKTIPGFFDKGVKGITNFFTKTLPSLPAKAFDGFFFAIGRVGAFFTKDIPRFASAAGNFISAGFNTAFDLFFIGIGRIGAFFTKDIPRYAGIGFRAITNGLHNVGHFFTHTLPGIVSTFFTETIPNFAGQAWTFIQTNLWDPFVGFIKAIPGFFTETIPKWFSSAWEWYQKSVGEPVRKFVFETIPNFFTETIPKWFTALPGVLDEHVVQPVTKFFGTTVPDFFTKDVPAAISKLPGFLYSNLVQPVLDFFGGIAGHIGDFLKGSWDWAKGLFNRASSDVKEGYNSGGTKKMSGGLIEGVYQGIEDTAKLWATPGEWVVRRSKVEQPMGKRFLSDFTEGRIDPARFYAGLAQTTAPQTMSIVAPDASSFAGQVPSVVNHNVDNSLKYGDVIIHNPVREKSEYSLRRQLQIANIRHRGRG